MSCNLKSEHVRLYIKISLSSLSKHSICIELSKRKVEEETGVVPSATEVCSIDYVNLILRESRNYHEKSYMSLHIQRLEYTITKKVNHAPKAIFHYDHDIEITILVFLNRRP